MALPKGSRKIVVDGLPYRWYIRGKPSYDQSMGWSNLTIAIEREEAPHITRLVAQVAFARPDSLAVDGGPKGYITPADVAQIIRSALADGWLADQQGSPWTYTVKDVGTEID